MSSLSVSSTKNSSPTSPTNDSSEIASRKECAGPNWQGTPTKIPTIQPSSNETIEKVLTIVSKMIELVASLISALKGKESSIKPSTQSGSSGSNSAGSSSNLPGKGEFLWKPVSDKNGKLAILLPKDLMGDVKSVKVLASNSNKVLETGVFSGVGNGEREHYRFNKPGSSFPDGSRVQITMKDGSTKTITIKETSSRFEK